MKDLRTWGRGTGLLLLILAIGLVAACGGGGTNAATDPADETTHPPIDDTVPPPADDPADEPSEPPVDIVESSIASYSPFLVEDEDGQPMSLAWVYRVNGGQSIEVNAYDTVGTVTFDAPLVVVYNPEAGQRNTMAPFVFEGLLDSRTAPMEGQGILDVNELVECREDETVLLSRRSALTMDARSDGDEYGLQALADLFMESALPWYPDRDDLGDVPDGTIVGPVDEATGMLAGVVSLLNPLGPNVPDEYEMTVSSRQTWDVISHVESMEVLGRTYRDVVVVDLWAIVPDFRQPNETPESTAAEPVRMWFAKGVGLIKAEGMYRLWGRPVGVELIETNFTE